MKEMTIRVPDDSVSFVEEFIERIGGDFADNKSIKEPKKNIAKRPKPLDFFGKFPDLDLDPQSYRDDLWKRKES